VTDFLLNLNSLECFKTFKTAGQMVLELSFDPSSKFLAAGTADSHVKVYDVNRGFQTHNLLGHRGIINKLVFYPEEDSLKLISCSEDRQIKVWDLVIRAEIVTLK
jgi:WD40 repeat protein